jgi:hypothetical protein
VSVTLPVSITSFNLRKFEDTSSAGNFPIRASAARPSLPRGAFITSRTGRLLLRKAFKFHRREESRNQSFAQEPGRRAPNAVFAAKRLGLRDGCRGTAIGKGGVQRREVDMRFTRVSIDHGGILEVLTKDKMRFK